MKNTIYAALLCSILAGCAASIGSVENTVTPPKLVKGPDGVVMWDNLSAFGPVPKEKIQEYGKVCEAANPKWYAAGYNSKAIGLDGKPFPDGGFVCLYK